MTDLNFQRIQRSVDIHQEKTHRNRQEYKAGNEKKINKEGDRPTVKGI